MKKSGFVFFIALALPAFAEDPQMIVPSKNYVDSGLAQKATTAIVQAFQTRPEGFATAGQGAKADAIDTALITNDTIAKANSALQSADFSGFATTTYVDGKTTNISKTQLAADIQASLGKADAAVQPAELAGYIPTAQKAAPDGVASLGVDSKVPVAQLPVGTATATIAAGDDVRFMTIPSTAPAGNPPAGQVFLWFE